MAAVDRQPELEDSDIPVTHERGLRNYKDINQDKKIAKYSYFDAVKDYMKQFTMNDTTVETDLLSVLPFYPESDGKRKAQIIDTPISNNNFIHEFYIENIEPTSNPPKDIVLIHGYAASLGLFFGNFEALSSIPGARVHAIDLLGFGFSSRPKFPDFKYDTVEDVEKVEAWFTDAIEEWRQNRNINNFILMGHSFGGYLSACYTMKYNKKMTDTQNLVDKLVLISPVGVERNKYSLLKNIPNPYFDDETIKAQNQNDTEIHVENEFLQDQKSVTSKKSDSCNKPKPGAAPDPASLNPKYHSVDFSEDTEPKTRRRKIIEHLWAKNFSPIQLFRVLGPVKAKAVNMWTSRRFADYQTTNPNITKLVQDYMYRNLNSKGSGEHAITRVLDFGALPRVPLSDRLPQNLEKTKTPTLLLYGDVDWMNVEAGKELTDEINELSSRHTPLNNLAKFKVVKHAGHHLYLDNPGVFHDSVLRFIK